MAVTISVDVSKVCARPSCTNDVEQDIPFCRSHVEQIIKALRDLPSLYVQLRMSLVPSSGTGSEKVSGSKTAPLPLNVGALSLADDIAGYLCDIEDSLRKVLGFVPAGRRDSTADEPLRRDSVWHPREGPRVAAASRFLIAAIEQLLDSPTGDYAGNELIDLAGQAKALLGGGRGDVRLPVPCPSIECQSVALVREGGSDVVRCEPRLGGCGRVETVARLIHITKEDLPAVVLPAVRMATLMEVQRSTVSRWITAGRLEQVACAVPSGQPQYRVEDAMRIQAEKAAAS